MNPQETIFPSTTTLSRNQHVLSLECESHLFEVYCRRVPGDPQSAAQELLLGNVPLISRLARRFAVLYPRLNYDDLFQHGCQIFLEGLKRVPQDHPFPGKWLYKCVQGRFTDLLYRDEWFLDAQTMSLDQERKTNARSSDLMALVSVLADPVSRSSEERHTHLERRAQALHNALHRLATHQQQAIQCYFDLTDFVPIRKPLSATGNHSKFVQDPTPQVLRDRRKRAYKALRYDPQLLQVIQEV